MFDATGFRYARYDAPQGPEWMMVHGAGHDVPVLILGALFNEHNLTRAIVAEMARCLAGAGIASFIPDLPGTGESSRALASTGWEEWRTAAAAAARQVTARSGTPPHVVALRGGALLDDACAGTSWWRLAPARGAQLLRDMERAQKLGDRERETASAPPPDGALDLVGYRMDPALHGPLRQAAPADVPGPLRTMPFEGAAPWRRTAPGADGVLSRRLADDIAGWVRSCGG